MGCSRSGSGALAGVAALRWTKRARQCENYRNVLGGPFRVSRERGGALKARVFGRECGPAAWTWPPRRRGGSPGPFALPLPRRPSSFSWPRARPPSRCCLFFALSPPSEIHTFLETSQHFWEMLFGDSRLCGALGRLGRGKVENSEDWEFSEAATRGAVDAKEAPCRTAMWS